MKRLIFESSSIRSTRLADLFITIWLGGFRAIAKETARESIKWSSRRDAIMLCDASSVLRHRRVVGAKPHLPLPTQPSLIVPRRESIRRHKFSMGGCRAAHGKIICAMVGLMAQMPQLTGN